MKWPCSIKAGPPATPEFSLTLRSLLASQPLDLRSTSIEPSLEYKYAALKEHQICSEFRSYILINIRTLVWYARPPGA